jgi:hypothetical protein
MRSVLKVPKMCIKGISDQKEGPHHHYRHYPLLHNASIVPPRLKHSEASIRSSLMQQRWGLRSFLVLLKTLSHSADIVGTERVVLYPGGSDTCTLIGCTIDYMVRSATDLHEIIRSFRIR